MDVPTALPGTPPTIELDALHAAVAAELPEYLDDLRALVDIDCGSYTADGVNRIADWASDFLGGLGASVERRPDPAGRLGDTVVATFTGSAGGPRVLLIGHMDTVFDPGPPPSGRSASTTASPTAPA